MISEAASESRSVNSALISIFPPPSGRVNVVGFSVGFSSSIPPLRTVHFRKKKFSAGVAVRVTVSPGMADAGLASAVPLPSSVTVIWLGTAANSALISTFAAGIANVVGLAVALFSSASPLRTVHFANEKFSLASPSGLSFHPRQPTRVRLWPYRCRRRLRLSCTDSALSSRRSKRRLSACIPSLRRGARISKIS